MSAIISNTSSQVVIDPNLGNRAVEQKQSTVGNGISGVGGEAPPAPAGDSVANAIKSLSGFMSSASSKTDVAVLLVEVAVTMRDAEALTQKSKINSDQETKRAQMKEREGKLEEAAKKLDKVQHMSIWDKIKLAFQWIAAAIATAVAAVMIATGVGAAVGVALMAAAVTAVVMAVDATVAKATGHGIAGNIAKAAGASPEAIAKADMGFQIATMVVGLAAAVGSLGAGIASSATSLSSQLAKTVSNVLSAIDKVASVGSAVTTIGSAVAKKEETDTRADAKRLESQAKTDEALMQVLDDAIDQALQRLKASSDRFNQILDDIVSGLNDRSNTLSRARFSA